MKTLKDFHPAREMPETLVRVPTFILDFASWIKNLTFISTGITQNNSN